MPLDALAQSFASQKRFKAGGPDLVTGDLVRAAPGACARLVHPLLTKTSLLGREPLSFKGGWAHPLYKGSGPPSLSVFYRQILLMNVIAKCHHRFMRERVCDIAVSLLLATQCGGCKGRGTDIAGHYVRAFQAYDDQQKRSSVLAFADLKAAFYTVVREILLPLDTSEDDRDAIVAAAPTPPALVPVLQAMMANPFLDPAKINDAHLADLLNDAHRCTWFAVKDAPAIGATRTGTRPGGSLADLIFNLVFLPMLRDLRDELKARDITVLLDCSPHPVFAQGLAQEDAFLSEVAFVDDLAIPTMTSDNDNIEAHIVLVIEAIYLIAAQSGFALNFGPTKTAVLVSLRGPAWRMASEKLFVHQQAKVWLPLAKVWVPLPNTYKHLGSILHRDGLMAPEIAYRKTSQKQAIGPLQRAVYKRHQLPTKSKFNWTDSLCTSRLLFNACTWPQLTDTTWQTLRTAYLHPYRLAMGRGSKGPNTTVCSNMTVLAESQRPDLDLALRIRRLKFFGRVLLVPPPSAFVSLGRYQGLVRKLD